MTLASLILQEDVLSTPQDIISQFPLKMREEEQVSYSRRNIENIIHKRDPRHLLIVGPCSIHDEESTYEYAKKLKHLSMEVADSFFIVMRAYIEKPRTLKGWKGLLYDPDLDGSYDLEEGLRLSRKILVNLIEMGMPIGSEILEINSSPYFMDLLSWGCIGARTCASQPHRQLAASLPFPIGFKNATSGNILDAINGVKSAASSHIFLGMDHNGQLAKVHGSGNSDCHLILRGGEENSNFDRASVATALEKCEIHGIARSLFIDCSHGNCGKRHDQQITAFQSAIDQILEGNQGIRGIMLESHLQGGSQPITSSLKYGISITDPCLSWETTERLILDAHTKLLAL